MLSCLWIVASWFSCKRDWSQEWPMPPSWWYHSSQWNLYMNNHVYEAYSFQGSSLKRNYEKWIIGVLGGASLVLVSRGYWILINLWHRVGYCLDWRRPSITEYTLILGTRKMSTIVSWIRLSSQEVNKGETWINIYLGKHLYIIV